MTELTFNTHNICWFDFETKSGEDLQAAGATRYACDPDAKAMILTYAIGLRPVCIVTAPVPGEALTWKMLPDDFRGFYETALLTGEVKYAAFNAGFDRAIWNWAVPGAPPIHPHMCIDPSVQATVAGLPPDLAGACKQAGAIHKIEGAQNIALFCAPDAVGTPETHPAEWAAFCAYAKGDIESMRSLFRRTRQLPLREWQEYWAMEAINDRGIRVDVTFATKADRLTQEAKVYNGLELRQLTGGAVIGVGNVKALTAWLINRLPLEGIEMLTRQEEEEDEDGTITRPAKYSLTRPRVEKLIPYCHAIGDHTAERALQIRLYGGSTTPAKYRKILDQEVDGAIYGQYVFNGAPQTGRASSRGVQIQNLSRAFLPYEHEAIEAVLDDIEYAKFAVLGDTTPVARKLALLIRPAFVPNITNQFVVSDFAQIEARILPWLVGPKSLGALQRLQIFRDVDNDPSVPDIYTRSAADISGVPVAEIDKMLRQRGKVAELALGFGGGVGALAAMGASYGLYLPPDEAKQVVERWRKANPWCVRFWGKHSADTSYGLWGAANRAMEQPGSTQTVGRVSYTFAPRILGGTLFCQLPSGRFMSYRGIRYETVEDKDDDGKVIDRRTELRFWKGHNRAHIWHGTLCENIVQATAADLLRGTLVRLEQAGLGARLHSHDECLIECAEDDVPGAAIMLRDVMRRGFDWTDGLPLMSEEVVLSYYSKWEA
jgi:DNA polymerase